MSAQPAGELETDRIPASMLCWQSTGPGEPPEVLALNEIDVPAAGPGEVLVEVWSAGLSLADVQLLRAGPGHPLTPGLEFCGEVVAVGEGVARTRLDERVIGVTVPPHGSLARFALARAKDVMPAPARLDDASASVFHLAYQAGWMGLYRRASVRVGETLLVHAAAGGLGGAAVQLGRAAGATVIAVVGSAEQAARGPAARCPARDRPHPPGRRRRRARAHRRRRRRRRLQPGRGRHDRAVHRFGRVRGPGRPGRVRLWGAGGAGGAGEPGELGEAGTFGSRQLLAGNFSVFGVGWGRYLDARPEIVVRAHADLSSLAEVGALRPMIGARLSFEDAPQGLAALGAGTAIGAVAVTPP